MSHWFFFSIIKIYCNAQLNKKKVFNLFLHCLTAKLKKQFSLTQFILSVKKEKNNN